MNEEILQQIIGVVGTILLALVTWGGAELTRLIRHKVESGKRQDALLVLNEFAETVAARGIQTTVKRAKARAQDGKLSKVESREVMDLAVRDVRQYLGTEGVKALGRVVGSEKTDRLIADTLERAVLHNKL